jgi:hypothetical protein
MASWRSASVLRVVEGGALAGSLNNTGTSRSAIVSRLMDEETQGFEAGPVATHRRGTGSRRCPVRTRRPVRRGPAGARSRWCAAGPGRGLRSRPGRGLWPAPSGPRRTRSSSRPRKRGALEAAPVGHHHQVLIAHEPVGMVGHRGQRRLGRAWPGLRWSADRRPDRTRSMRKRRKGWASATARRSASGSVRARSAGSAPAGKGGHGHVDGVVTFPFVDPGGPRFAGGVGVIGQHHPGGEVAEDPEVFFAQGRATGGHGPGQTDAGRRR